MQLGCHGEPWEAQREYIYLSEALASIHIDLDTGYRQPQVLHELSGLFTACSRHSNTVEYLRETERK